MIKGRAAYGVLALCALSFLGCTDIASNRPLPNGAQKTRPSQEDLIEFHRERAREMDSLIDAKTAQWKAVIRSGTGIRHERLDSMPDAPRVADLKEGTVLELHHKFSLLDGRVITQWEEDGPLAFEPGSTDLPSGFHELIGQAHIGDSLRALIPPIRAWGMSGLPPDIPQEAVILAEMRLDLYRRTP